MSDRSRKIAKPAAALGVLATMASIWWFALRPRRKSSSTNRRPPCAGRRPPGPRRGPARCARSSRNFALIWSAALVSNVGSWMQTVALGVLVFARTDKPGWTGLVAAAGFVPIGLLAPIGGALADRLDRRRWLIVTTLAETAFAAVLAVLAATHHDPPVGPGRPVLPRRCGRGDRLPGLPGDGARPGAPRGPARRRLALVGPVQPRPGDRSRAGRPRPADPELRARLRRQRRVVRRRGRGPAPGPPPAAGRPSPARRIDGRGGSSSGARAARAEPGCRSRHRVHRRGGPAGVALHRAGAGHVAMSVRPPGWSLALVTAVLVTAQGVGAVAGALALPVAGRAVRAAAVLRAALLVAAGPARRLRARPVAGHRRPCLRGRRAPATSSCSRGSTPWCSCGRRPPPGAGS